VHRTSLTSRFLAGWEPAPLPPRGPDGMIPAPPPRSLPVVQPPSLCEAGPCRNFHRVQSLMDAQEPLDGTDGTVHPQVTRACYPAPGIELELGETPVMRCSRWEPDSEQARLDSIRDVFLKSPAGKVFAQQVQAFDAAVEEAHARAESEAKPAINTDEHGQPADEGRDQFVDGLTNGKHDFDDDDLDALEDAEGTVQL
jgi:hypothetical protein